MDLKPPIIEPRATEAEDLDRARRQKLAQFAKASRANNTQKVYESTWRQFVAFCAGLGVDPLAASGEIIGFFLLEFVERGAKAATIRRAYFAIRHELTRRIGEDNASGDRELKRSLEGILRTLSTDQTRAKALTAPLLKKVIWAACGDELCDFRDRALLLVMYGAALRRSEALALRVCDVEELEGGVALTLQTTKASKNRPVRVVVGPAQSASFCPVRALRAWLDVHPKKSPWLFCGTWQAHSMEQRMSFKTLTQVIRRRLLTSGIDPEGFSSHSLRSGLVTDLNAAGMSPVVVQHQSRHRSADMLLRYHRPDGEQSLGYTQAAGL